MTIARDVVLQLILLAVAAGAMITMAIAMLRAKGSAARLHGFIFDIAVACFAFKIMNDGLHLFPMWAIVPICALAVSTVGWFWLFMTSLFEDSCKTCRWQYGAVATLTVTGLLGMYTHGWISTVGWLTCNVIQVAMAVHALAMIMRGWKGDLVEARRNVRGPFLIACAVYIIALRGFDVADMFGAAPTWYPLVNALALAVICVSGAFVFLDPREDLFGVRAPAQPALAPLPVAANAPGPEIQLPTPALDRTTEAELCRLEKLMSVDEVWREEGLTVAGLALRVGVPETQLRRLINDQLGFRNFPSFVNARRIACAKGRLADPDEARVSISAIAFEIGFASLGPFNRAFREAVGKPPSEWRREALAAAPTPTPEPAARSPRVAAE